MSHSGQAPAGVFQPVGGACGPAHACVGLLPAFLQLLVCLIPSTPPCVTVGLQFMVPLSQLR